MRESLSATKIAIICLAFMLLCAWGYRQGSRAKQFQARQFEKIEKMLDISEEF